MEEITENQIKQGTAEDSGRTGINSDHEAYQLYRKINIYDTVFKLFFQDLENVRKFYESLTNRNIRVENIEKVTLEEGTSFDSQLRNDLGFIVKNDHAQDEFVILTEAQSTWNDNMPYRFLEYVTAIFREYIKSHKIERSTKKRFYLPRPRFYLIYTGMQNSKPDKLRFSEMYGDVSVDDDILNFSVHVFSSASTDTVHGQYIGFCKIVSDLRKSCKDYVEFVSAIREECCNKGYNLFEEFIDNHKTKMEAEMDQVFEDELSFNDYIQKERKIAVEKATPEIEKAAVEKATPGIEKAAVEKMIIDLFTDHLITIEAAASKLNVTVPAFEEMLKKSA